MWIWWNFIDSWKLKRGKTDSGTIIELKINSNTERSCADIFRHLFEKKRIIRAPVVLARFNDEKLISRGQAGFLVHNISDLDKIEFDFKGVNIIGPAFADALIRKTKGENRSIDVGWVNTTDTVDVLMSRAAKRVA